VDRVTGDGRRLAAPRGARRRIRRQRTSPLRTRPHR
jgi:hypothetical protein